MSKLIPKKYPNHKMYKLTKIIHLKRSHYYINSLTQYCQLYIYISQLILMHNQVLINNNMYCLTEQYIQIEYQIIKYFISHS